MDGHGDLDVVLGYRGGLLTLLNDGEGGLGPANASASAQDQMPTAIHLTDINDDGILDVVAIFKTGLDRRSAQRGQAAALIAAL